MGSRPQRILNRAGVSVWQKFFDYWADYWACLMAAAMSRVASSTLLPEVNAA